MVVSACQALQGYRCRRSQLGPTPSPISAILARYSAGRPNARPQSLANTTDPESSSHAGEKLLQLPPDNRCSLPLERSRIQNHPETRLGPAADQKPGWLTWRASLSLDQTASSSNSDSPPVRKLSICHRGPLAGKAPPLRKPIPRFGGHAATGVRSGLARSTGKTIRRARPPRRTRRSLPVAPPHAESVVPVRPHSRAYGISHPPTRRWQPPLSLQGPFATAFAASTASQPKEKERTTATPWETAIPVAMEASRAHRKSVRKFVFLSAILPTTASQAKEEE